MSTEYEQLLEDMLKERKAKLETLKSERKGKQKEMDGLQSEMGFIEVELSRYRHGLTLFRTKDIPKVGRWGKPEAEGHTAEEPESE